MVAIEDTVQTLRKDLGDILRKYPISPEERSFIIEKIEDTINDILKIQHGVFTDKLSEIRGQIGTEREEIQASVEGLKRAAVERITEANEKVGTAYEKGVAIGAASVGEPEEKPGFGTINIILAIFFAALAFVVVASMFFGSDKKEKKG
jgi:ElaB/YqjD/DUF883 family membrane-anchored ribosome-binding protein